MNYTDIIKKYAKNQEEKLLISRFCDHMETAVSRHCYCFSHFLSPAEQSVLLNISKNIWDNEIEMTFMGGFEASERRLAVICPLDFYGKKEQPPLKFLALHYKGEPLTHRDILGALMGLGIERNRIGDIIDRSNPQIIVCEEGIAEFLLQNFDKAGRTKVTLEVSSYSEPDNLEDEVVTATVSSLRLDSILAEGFGISRTKAAEVIRRGLVNVNWKVVESPSASIREGDKISCRGMGKIKLQGVGGISRKGRTFVHIIKYN